MSVNIVDLIKTYVQPDLISKASSFLGESEGGITKAVSGFIPSILGGVLNKTSSSEADAQQMLDTAKEANSSGLLGNLGSLFGNTDLLSKGSGWFSSLFGGQSDGVVSAISNFAGVKASSSQSLIGMITPLIMGVLGKQAADNNLNASGFSSFLNTQKSSILSALPSGLGSIASTLGLGSVGAAAREAVGNVTASSSAAFENVTQQAEKSGGGMKWLLPLLLLGAAFLVWWLMGKGCNKGEGGAATDDTTTTTMEDTSAMPPAANTSKGMLDSTTGNYIYDVGENKTITLADGTVLNVGENSTEAKLYDMLSNPSFTVDTVDKSANWIVLDRVYFETGKSVLTTQSAEQIKNVGAILKNFPNAVIKLGGYTDNTGDEAINKKISASRAKIVADEVVKAGATAKQVAEAEGYGPEFPVCAANDTPECKAMNRRVDLKVASK